MFFTQEDYRKIQQWLTKNSVKDTEFNEANIPFNGNEIVSIVQGNQNKKVFLKDLIAQIFNLGVSDFVNITDKYDAPNISLEEAIRLIPSRARKEGQVITFLDREDHWHIYQFKGVLNQWNVLDQWEDLFDWEKLIIDSILPDEEDLTKSLPDENGNSYLSLKDREYNPEDFSGLGRVILRKNIVEVEDPTYGKVKKNILYQDMINKENTIYEIRYDFDLISELQSITIPNNCVLYFNGGLIKNGNIIFTNTKIIDIKGGFEKCRFAGTLDCKQNLYISTFGVIADGQHDDSLIINDVLNCINEKGCEIIFDCDGDYGIGNSNLHSTVSIKSNTTLTFTGKGFFKLLSYSDGGQVVLINNSKNVVINNIQIDGGGSAVLVGVNGQNGIGCGNSQNIQVNGGHIKNCYKGLDTEINGKIIYGDGGKGIQIESYNVDNFIAKGVFIENCFRALSSRRDFSNEGPVICQFLGIHAKNCEQFASINQMNGEDITGTEHSVIISDFICENCGSYDGIFIFGRARNVQILNGTIIGTKQIGSIFRGRFGYCNINNLLILQPFESLINLIPSVYGEDQSGSNYNTINVNILSKYSCIAKTDNTTNKNIAYSHIKIFSKNFPTNYIIGSPFSSGYVNFDLNFEGNNRFIGTSTQFYHVCNNKLSNIKGTIFADWPRQGTTQLRESLKEEMLLGTTYFDTDKRRLIIKYSGGFVDTDGNEAVASFGTSASRPIAPSTAAGCICYETDTKRKILWNGSQWCDLDGTSLDKSVSRSAQRPTTAIRVGYMCYDKEINKPIWIKSINNNTTPATVVWVDATGAEV